MPDAVVHKFAGFEIKGDVLVWECDCGMRGTSTLGPGPVEPQAKRQHTGHLRRMSAAATRRKARRGNVQ